MARLNLATTSSWEGSILPTDCLGPPPTMSSWVSSSEHSSIIYTDLPALSGITGSRATLPVSKAASPTTSGALAEKRKTSDSPGPFAYSLQGSNEAWAFPLALVYLEDPFSRPSIPNSFPLGLSGARTTSNSRGRARLGWAAHPLSPHEMPVSLGSPHRSPKPYHPTGQMGSRPAPRPPVSRMDPYAIRTIHPSRRSPPSKFGQLDPTIRFS